MVVHELKTSYQTRRSYDRLGSEAGEAEHRQGQVGERRPATPADRTQETELQGPARLRHVARPDRGDRKGNGGDLKLPGRRRPVHARPCAVYGIDGKAR